MDMKQYLEVFIEESKEHLQACNENLLALEKNPADLLLVSEIFRSAHTLKGMSATMGYEDIASLTHQMENVLDAIRSGNLPITAGLLDVVFSAVDHLEEMVQSIEAGGDGKRDVSETVYHLKMIEKGEEIKADSEIAASLSVLAKPSKGLMYDDFEMTVIRQSREQGFNAYEVTVELREDCLLKAARVYMIFDVLEKAGEIVKAEPSVDQLEDEQFDNEFMVTLITVEQAAELEMKLLKVAEVNKVNVAEISERISGLEDAQEIEEAPISQIELVEVKPSSEVSESAAEPTSSGKLVNSTKTIRVNIERLDSLMNLFEELVIDRGRLESISNDLNNQALNETVEHMSRISGDLQSIILNMRMVQVETVFNRFPRMVRQLARDLKKQIRLEIVGADTELDRTVIDEIGDPLVHLLRNSIDHGIEAPDIRKANGKSEEGTIYLRAYHSGNHVFIEIQDDGAGIGKAKVLQKALASGIVTEKTAAELEDKQIYELIMASGFSTADRISDISGRGVGLDVVKTTIESLGGMIEIDSVEGEGSTFSIQLPLTLSIMAVMLIKIHNEKFAIPLSSIIVTAIVKKEDVLKAHNEMVIDYRGRIVPLLFLEDLFGVPVIPTEKDSYSVIIVRKGEKLAGLVVDSFIGQQEVVLKSLGNYLTNVFAISGATILGDGQVALIVDCNAMIK